MVEADVCGDATVVVVGVVATIVLAAPTIVADAVGEDGVSFGETWEDGCGSSGGGGTELKNTFGLFLLKLLCSVVSPGPGWKELRKLELLLAVLAAAVASFKC